MTTPEDIRRQIKALRVKTQDKPVSRPASHYQMIVRMAVEMAAAIITGVMIGWWLDELLDTSPYLLILCMLFSMVAGFVTLKRVNDAFVKQNEKSDTESQ